MKLTYDEIEKSIMGSELIADLEALVAKCNDIEQAIVSGGGGSSVEISNDTNISVTGEKALDAVQNNPAVADTLAYKIADNTADIEASLELIEANTADISEHSADIEAHATAIEANTSAIESNTETLATHTQSIAENKSAIEKNATDIAALKGSSGSGGSVNVEYVEDTVDYTYKDENIHSSSISSAKCGSTREIRVTFSPKIGATFVRGARYILGKIAGYDYDHLMNPHIDADCEWYAPIMDDENAIFLAGGSIVVNTAGYVYFAPPEQFSPRMITRYIAHVTMATDF